MRTQLVMLWLLLLCACEDPVVARDSGLPDAGTLHRDDSGAATDAGHPPLGKCEVPQPFLAQLYDANLKLVAAALSTEVVVESVVSCAHTDCPGAPPETATLYVLVEKSDDDIDAGAAANRWRMVVQLEALPADRIAAAAVFQLTVVAGFGRGPFRSGQPSQTIVLSQGPAPVMALSAQKQRFVELPDLSSFGIALSPDRLTCEDQEQPLGHRSYALRAASGDSNIVVTRGSTERLGDLSVSLFAYDKAYDERSSDLPELFELGIFQTQP